MGRKTSSELLNTILISDVNENCKIEIEQHLEYSRLYRTLLQDVADRDPENISVFDTLDLLCDHEKRVCESYKDGHILYRYTDHISDYAAGLIGAKLNRLVRTMSN